MVFAQTKNLIPAGTKRAAAEKTPAAAAALEKLCHGYWRPIYSSIRREEVVRVARDDVEDLTHAFFARLIAMRSFEAVRQEKGRLRTRTPAGP